MSIHPTAIVDAKAEIDPSVHVGPHCIIDAHVRIAAGCRLIHNVFVTGWTSLGENCVLHPGVVVGHEPQDVKYKGERSYCRVGRDVVLREYVTVHRGTDPESETVIGDGCFLLAGAHVAHNCRLGNHVTMINNVLLAGHVEVGDRALLSGGAGVHQFARIGQLSMIAGNARVPKDVVPYAMVDVEGRIAGINRIGMRRSGLSRDDLVEVRNAYRVLFDTKNTFEARLAGLSKLSLTSVGTSLLEFARGPSKRGLAGRERRLERDAAPIE